MNALVEQTSFGVTTNSRTVAEVFTKEHHSVLRAIDELIHKRPDLRDRKFVATSVDIPMPKGGGVRQVRAFEMNRDGFALLAFGFTGEEALDWKLTYIDAFNRMEAEIAARRDPPERPVTDIELPPLAELIKKVAVGEAYRRNWGPDAGRWMMALLGLPIPPGSVMLVEPDGLRIIADNVAEWLAEACEQNAEAKEMAGDLYRSYQEWCAENRRVPETQTGFGRALTRMGIYGFKSGSGRMWRRGLKLLG